jgi:phage baseplate assembly protein V
MSGVFDFLTAVTRQGPTLVGVSRAQVVDNMDTLGLGRVQISLAWQPDLEPWAPVAVLSAGSDRGTYFIPQVGDEVLVAFEHGDVLQPFVVGSLWNGSDSPPATAPTDPVARRIIKTPAGHEIELDDTAQTITITSSSSQTVKITSDKIELSAGSGAAVLTLETSGTVKLQASTKLELKAPDIKLSATNLELSADAAATLKASGNCTVQGSLVRIN